MKKNISRFPKYFLCTSYTVLSAFFSFAQPATFNYTGAVQTYTVIACTYSVTVDAKAASGAAVSTNYSVGGFGGRVQTTLAVTPGEVLTIYVGEQPASTIGGWNGGGNGGTSGGAGGGASDIRQGGSALSNRIIVAGGGAGGGYDDAHVYNNRGGNGGGTTGAEGYANNSQTFSYTGGGGTQTAGGAAGTGTANGYPGALGTGGNADATYGGGGGAGYYGGGGGAQNLALYGGGGGGGSSYAIPAATGVTHTQGFQTGNGQIIITPVLSSGPSTPGSITGSDSACANSSGNYSISSVAAATNYTWTAPSGSTISGQNTTSVTVTFGSVSGNISVTASNSCGTSTASTKAITVNANPTANAGSDVTICSGSSATLSASGGTNYLWNTGETTAAVAVTPTVTTTYTVVVSDSSGCSATDEVNVTVTNGIMASAGNDITICNGDTAMLTASGGINYSWSTGETTIAVAVAPVVTTTYTVTVSDSSGCSGTDNVTVAVDSCATGIFSAASNQNNITISPNPTTGKLLIHDSRFTIQSLEIYNMYGEKVYSEKNLDTQSLILNMDFLSGIYFLKVIPPDNYREAIGTETGITIHKIIKQ